MTLSNRPPVARPGLRRRTAAWFLPRLVAPNRQTHSESISSGNESSGSEVSIGTGETHLMENYQNPDGHSCSSSIELGSWVQVKMAGGEGSGAEDGSGSGSGGSVDVQAENIEASRHSHLNLRAENGEASGHSHPHVNAVNVRVREIIYTNNDEDASSDGHLHLNAVTIQVREIIYAGNNDGGNDAGNADNDTDSTNSSQISRLYGDMVSESDQEATSDDAAFLSGSGIASPPSGIDNEDFTTYMNRAYGLVVGGGGAGNVQKEEALYKPPIDSDEFGSEIDMEEYVARGDTAILEFGRTDVKMDMGAVQNLSRRQALSGPSGKRQDAHSALRVQRPDLDSAPRVQRLDTPAPRVADILPQYQAHPESRVRRHDSPAPRVQQQQAHSGSRVQRQDAHSGPMLPQKQTHSPARGFGEPIVPRQEGQDHPRRNLSTIHVPQLASGSGSLRRAPEEDCFGFEGYGIAGGPGQGPIHGADVNYVNRNDAGSSSCRRSHSESYFPYTMPTPWNARSNLPGRYAAAEIRDVPVDVDHSGYRNGAYIGFPGPGQPPTSGHASTASQPPLPRRRFRPRRAFSNVTPDDECFCRRLYDLVNRMERVNWSPVEYTLNARYQPVTVTERELLTQGDDSGDDSPHEMEPPQTVKPLQSHFLAAESFPPPVTARSQGWAATHRAAVSVQDVPPLRLPSPVQRLGAPRAQQPELGTGSGSRRVKWKGKDVER